MTVRALVLSGGGAKGAYQVGVLRKWILDEGRDYGILCGVSVGALNAAFLAQASMGALREEHAALEGAWRSVRNEQVRRSWFLGKLAALWKPSVYDSTPLEEWVKRDIHPERIAASGRRLRVGAVSWETGEYYAATEADPQLATWVAASASFPVFLKPVTIAGDSWTDGGVRTVTPLGEAIRLGATEIDVVQCGNADLPSPWSAKDKSALPDFALRAVEVMTNEIERTDLQVCGLKNDLAKLGAKYRYVKVSLVRPSAPLVDDALEFDPAAIRYMLEVGYADAHTRAETLA